MAIDVKRVEYYNTVIEDKITEEWKLISAIAEAGIDFYAFKSIPLNSNERQFTFISKGGSNIKLAGEKSGLKFEGPYPALYIRGAEKQGALAGIFEKLSVEGIDVDEACGLADINSGYGVLLYLNYANCEKALHTLAK